MVNKRKIKAQKDAKREANKHKLPFVSVCTPTFNRRPFIPYAIKNFLNQDYPHEKMEWIIIDDGTDPIEDLVKDVSGVKYFRYEEKMSLGKKRNLMHEKSKGDILVYMDDDDYYPPERVSHAVEKLSKNPKALCSGSSEVYIWFRDNGDMYRFGPYGSNHATAGTFAFKRELLKITSYEDNAALAEEKHFLKNYTIPFVQLDPLKSILVFSHDHNTFDKRRLLQNPNDKYVRASTMDVKHFIKDEDTRDFYTNRINDLLKDYEPGLPIHKPDVLQQTKEIEERRRNMSNQTGKIMIQGPDGKQKELSPGDAVEMMKKQQEQMKNMEGIVLNMQKQLQDQQQQNKEITSKYNELLGSYKDILDKYEELHNSINTKNTAEQEETKEPEEETKEPQEEINEPEETITFNLS
jgi:glycosyltransferase involved in cell wall biosynthesis